MPLVYPFRTACGNLDATDAVLVRMRGQGLESWSEVAPWETPSYCHEYAAGTLAIIRDIFGPLLVGKDITSGDQIQSLLTPFKGNQFAKAALDLAWWDMYARSRNEPLYKTIGGKSPQVWVGADFGIMETVEALLKEIEGAVASGFKRVKLKYRPGWELDMIRAVRRHFPDTVFHVDCNSAYTLADLPMLKALDEFNLAMIEQPLSHDDLLEHIELRKQIKTPICLDESVNSVQNCTKALKYAACSWINIKCTRVGGLTNALKIHDLCRQAGVRNWVGGMGESGIGQAFALALSTLDNINYPCDVFPYDRFYAQDLGSPPIVLSGPSQITASDAPGIGVAPDATLLRRWTVATAAVA